MTGFNIADFSSKYQVRSLTQKDIPLIYELCQNNPQFYEYCGHPLSRGLIERDMALTPPGFPFSDKYYIGFFDGETLIAVMDLLDGYPEAGNAFIGFFMMNRDAQGKGTGSAILDELIRCLRRNGYGSIRLGIDKFNPQSNHFWKKNGFCIIREVQQDQGIILLAERIL